MAEKIHIDEIAPGRERLEAIQEGLVRVKTDPKTGDLLYVYSKIAYGSDWPVAVSESRGLITDPEGYVKARPFARFHNLGTEHAPDWDDNTIIYRAYDKVDGSLIIVDDKGRITSKGSFDSDVAKLARGIWEKKYSGKVNLAQGYTYMFELVHPDNRIVLDYGGKEDLILLGGRENTTGHNYVPETIRGLIEWPGEIAERLAINVPLGEILDREDRDNAEGLILWTAEGEIAKLKYAEYKEAHRVVTGIDSIRVWEYMAVQSLGIAYPDAEPKQLTTALGVDPEVIEVIQGIEGNAFDYLESQLPEEHHDWLYREVVEMSMDVSSTRHRVIDRADWAILRMMDQEPSPVDHGEALYAILSASEKAIEEKDGVTMGAVLSLAKEAVGKDIGASAAKIPFKTLGKILKAAKPARRTAPSSIRNEVE